MSVIKKPIKLRGSKGEAEVVALFDSGSTYSCIREGLAKKLGFIEPLPEPMDFHTAKEGETMRTEEAIRLNFYLNGYRFSDEFMVVSRLSQLVLIGAATLQKWRIKLDFEQEEVIIDPSVTELYLL